MTSENGGSEVVSEGTMGARVLAAIQAGWQRWAGFKEWARNYTPYFVRFVEVLLAILFIVGFSYWLYLYFVVGA